MFCLWNVEENKMTFKIKYIKDTLINKKGEIEEYNNKEEAEVVVKTGDAEYVVEKKSKKDKNTSKKHKIKKDVNVKENTATPTLPTTHYYIKSWGYYNKYKKIIIEQIDPEHFLYNNNGKIGIALVEEKREIKDAKLVSIGKGFELKIDNEDILFLFKGRIYDARLFYNVPSLYQCEQFVNGKTKIRSYQDIQIDIKKSLKEMFDFTNQIDIETSNITIAQSWIKPLLNNFFFYGIDSTFGGGKTTLGEIVYFLMRHGFVGGNISTAALVRLADELDLNVFVDEIDQNQTDDDMMAMLRKGQRRNNPYVRCEGRDNHPVAYDIAGCHGFSYRSEIEDAFMSRSLRVHTSKSMDSRLPVINTYKQEVLKSLADELFFWFISNILVVGCSGKEGCSRTFNTYNISRDSIFNVLVRNLSADEVEYLKKVFGRDTELTYLCLETCSSLGINMLQEIKSIMTNKKADAESSESFYFDELKEFIHQNFISNICKKQLQDGAYLTSYFFPKNRLYAEFVSHLKNLNVLAIGTKKFSSLLRDLGFVEGDTIKSERYDNYPSPCLIFSPEILKLLELPSQAEIFEKMKEIESEKILKEFEAVK